MNGIGAISPYNQQAILPGYAAEQPISAPEFKRQADGFFQQFPEYADAEPLSFSQMASEHGLMRYTTQMRGLELELELLDQVEREADRLMLKASANEVNLAEVNSRLSSVNTLKTSFSLTTAAIGLGGAVILGTAGQIPAALALGASSLMTLTNEVADQLGVYEAIGKSLSQDKETQATIAQAMRYGTMFISFATSLASGALGGWSTLKEAVKGTLDPAMLQYLGQAGSSIVLFKQASIEKEKCVFDIEHLNLNMRLTLRNHERDSHDQNSQRTLEEVAKAFDFLVKNMQVEHKINQLITKM